VKHKDKLTGGKADKKSPKDFDKKALDEGTKHEMEHTKDKTLAQEIAMDHLAEDSEYYTKLKQVEKSDISKAIDPAAEASIKRDKIKSVIRKLKRKKKKVLGQVAITGVTKPQKRAKGDVKETKPEKHEGASKPKGPKKQVMVGRHGGQYVLTSGGKKKYADKTKKSLEAFIESDDKIKQFVKNFRSKKNG
jgi:hypothetical protein